ncbi:hypothetical protein LZ31DRAFT_57370 [Colletotrichum somersetense]|nr:hypothetical protein LZ31DRAFT_57370 [Colletotrichum somersetense]
MQQQKFVLVFLPTARSVGNHTRGIQPSKSILWVHSPRCCSLGTCHRGGTRPKAPTISLSRRCTGTINRPAYTEGCDGYRNRVSRTSA